MQKSEKFVIVQLKIDVCTLNVKNALLFVQSHYNIYLTHTNAVQEC